MDTHIKKFKEDIYKGISPIKVVVPWDEQSDLEVKVANYALIKSYELQNITKYTFFLILDTRAWKRKYLSRIKIYDEIFRLFIDLIDDFPQTLGFPL